MQKVSDLRHREPTVWASSGGKKRDSEMEGKGTKIKLDCPKKRGGVEALLFLSQDRPLQTRGNFELEREWSGNLLERVSRLRSRTF